MIARLKADFPVTYLCSKLGVSTSAFYDYWSVNRSTERSRRRSALIEEVVDVFAASNQMAGYRKVAAAIQRNGNRVNPKTVAVIMRQLGLVSPLARRSFIRAKARAVRVKDPADLVERQFVSSTPGTVLVGDITYVPTRQGWLYVATVIDLASRAVIGHASDARMTTPLVIQAMANARRSGLVKRGAIFHTDHGTQYRSKTFTDYCGRHGIRRSMGGRMECWDNAVAESFFSKLKSERLDWADFATRDAARAEVDDYINHFNTQRLHETLGYATPAEKIAALTAA
jgi:putative transposase